MSDTPGVKITADVVDLQTKLAVARAEMQSFSRSLNTAAREAASSGLTDTLKTSMAQSAEGLIKTRQEVDALSGSLGKAGVHVEGIREIGASLRALATGDIGALPERLGMVGAEIGHLGIAGVGAIAGVVGLGAALFDLAKHAGEAQEAMRSAEASFVFGQGAALTASKQQIDDWTAKIAAMPGQTEKSAAETVAALAKFKNASPALIDALVAGVPVMTTSLAGASKQIENFAQKWNEVQEKGGDSNAVIDEMIAEFKKVDEWGGHAQITQKSFWDTITLGAIASAGDVKALADATQQMDASKLQPFLDALQAVKGSGGIVAPKDTSSALDQFRLTVDQMEAAFKGSHEAMLAEAVKMWQGETKAAGLSDNQQRQAAMGLAEAQKEYNAAVTQSAKEELNKQVEADKQAKQQIAQIQKDQADTELQLGKIKIEGQREMLQSEVDDGKISAAQRLQIIKNLDDQEYDLERQTLQKELDNLDQSLTDYKVRYQQLYDQLEVLDAQHVQKMAADQRAIDDNNKKTSDDSEKYWERAGNLISRDLDEMLSGVLRGTQTWKQAELRLLDDLALSAIENIAKVGVEWALEEAKELAATIAKNAGILASNTTQAAASSAANAAAGEKTVLQDAKLAFSNVYAWVSAIPYVGPFLAPEAAAAAFAAVAAMGSFDQGTNFVPNDMIAQIHAGERIVPAADNAAMISALNGGGGAGVNNFNITIQALDTQTGTQFLKQNAAVIANAMVGQVRLGNSALSAAAQPS